MSRHAAERARGCLAAALLLAAGACFAQAAVPAPPADALRMALADVDYPVTPGDVYTLSYWQADVLATVTLTVEGDSSIDMGIFGMISGAGLTFPALKPRVKARVSSVYMKAVPSLTIASPGAFRVKVSGEVPQTRYVPAWGLSRLSEIVAAAATASSSLRNVQVLSRDGAWRSYDLFQAARRGSPAQDPYVRPGDEVVLTRAALTVDIKGEVRRPGSYQLLPGDTLETLVDMYGAGPTPGADTTRVTLDAWSDRGIATRVLDLSSLEGADMPLADGDVVLVPALTQVLPLVYFEGAVTEGTVTEGAAAQGASPRAVAADAPFSPRLALRLKEGETLRDALVEAWDSISAQADLGSAIIIRGDGSGTIYVDLRQVLLSRDGAVDLPLRPFDRVVIPAERAVVYVTGAVASPGSYPVRPGQDGTYYVGLAGGADSATASGSYTVTDGQGHLRAPREPVQAGDRVNVPRNGFLYGLTQWFPLVSSTVALVASVLTILQVAAQLGAR